MIPLELLGKQASEQASALINQPLISNQIIILRTNCLLVCYIKQGNRIDGLDNGHDSCTESTDTPCTHMQYHSESAFHGTSK